MLSVRSLSVCLSVTLVYRALWPMDQDETWHGGKPRPRSHCVRWRPSSPFQERDGTPHKSQLKATQFSAHLYCDQTARWIKMPLMEVCLGAGHIVLDGDAAPSRINGAQSPNFRSMSVVVKRSCISATAGHLLIGAYIKYTNDTSVNQNQLSTRVTILAQIFYRANSILPPSLPISGGQRR